MKKKKKRPEIASDTAREAVAVAAAVEAQHCTS